MEPISVPVAIEELLSIVKRLHDSYPGKKSTLDGRLVGDLGEVLVAENYDLTLHKGLRKHHDAEASDRRQVQIKTTMQNSLTFPADHVPDYYFGIKLHGNGKFDVVFNGPGSVAASAIRNRKPTKTNLHSISINALEILNKTVKAKDQIPKRLKE
jgi:hypothetical protein